MKRRNVERRREDLGYALKMTNLIYLGIQQSNTFFIVNQLPQYASIWNMFLSRLSTVPSSLGPGIFPLQISLRFFSVFNPNGNPPFYSA